MNINKHEYETRTTITERVITTYRYGSRAYECHTQESDYDFIVVVESDNPNLYYSVNMKDTNFTVYSEQMFIKRIKEHHISALECIFLYKSDKYREHFELDLGQLRRSISAVASNSYVKCKKKLKDGEKYIGMKSMFHSLRILNFGIQIAKYGEIKNYSSANVFLELIGDTEPEWAELDKRFKPIYNMLKSYFKKLAPLETD